VGHGTPASGTSAYVLIRRGHRSPGARRRQLGTEARDATAVQNPNRAACACAARTYPAHCCDHAGETAPSTTCSTAFPAPTPHRLAWTRAWQCAAARSAGQRPDLDTPTRLVEAVGRRQDGQLCHQRHPAAYSYILPEEIAPYRTLAHQFTLGDRMFQSKHRTQLRRAPVHDRRAIRQGVGEPERRRVGLRRQAGCARPAAGTERDRLARCLSLLRLPDHGGPAGRARHYLALLRAGLRHRPVLPALCVPGDPPHPFGPDWPVKVTSPETRV